jgi:hypothetical protein
MSIGLEELIRYWQGELPPEREAEVEETLFEDALTARRLDAIARLETGVRAVVAAGALRGALTVDTVERLQRAGLLVRTYEIDPGQTVPCSIAQEDLVVVRLRGDFASTDRVDVAMEGTLEGVGPMREWYEDTLVDRRSGEIVLVYPGDRIRALPRSQFLYTVTSGDRQLGEFRLDHTPSS